MKPLSYYQTTSVSIPKQDDYMTIYYYRKGVMVGMKRQYVMKDVFEVMRTLGWTGDDVIEVNVGGCAATGTATHPDANPKWAKPYGTVTYQKDAFIVIKNANRNPVVTSQAPQLSEGQQKPVVV